MFLYILAFQNTLDFKSAPLSGGIISGALCRLNASICGETNREDYT
jgi:hypothetical protein